MNTPPLTTKDIEEVLAIVIPLFDYLPHGEWRNLFGRCSWPETVYEQAVDYIPDQSRKPMIRLGHNQIKAVETVYDWLRLIDDKNQRLIVYFRHACPKPHLANDLLSKHLKCSVRTIQRQYNSGLTAIEAGLLMQRETRQEKKYASL